MSTLLSDLLQVAMARMSRERIAAAGNMRLGELIDKLQTIDPKKTVITLAGTSVGGFHSYRGYYEDLALEPSHNWTTVGELLERAKEALGNVFEGYKGGDFPMHRNSIIWLATYGNTSGIALAMVEEREHYVVLRGEPTDDCCTPEETAALRAFVEPVREAIRKAYAAGVAEGRLEAEQAADERIRELEAKVLGATIFSESDKQLVARALAVQGLRTPGLEPVSRTVAENMDAEKLFDRFLELLRDVEQPRRDRIETDDGPVELRNAPR